ncbi:hypothetical protein IL252_16910 [Halomicrobium sp. IBSBa]|uniref:hypothetical protein n=1 Tax=Halomicrobium sp. IBSBa TaxID=2778916 RepID=UPI001AC005A7|nr:hypothetical protein [Halomicrobium sp. IBSBa]MBO4249489.1 hypothetical protein [Halomicrobium sp. IBSBa]
MGLAVGTGMVSATGSAAAAPDVEVDYINFSGWHINVADGEKGTITVALKNNTNEEQNVLLIYTPYIFRNPPGKNGANEVEYSADLTWDDGINDTYEYIEPNSTVYRTYQWIPHLGIPADVGIYGAEIEAKAGRNEGTHDVEQLSNAFYVRETDGCDPPTGQTDIATYHVNRSGDEC